ncbi:MAG: choline-sulfatase [Alphaproteobacteria bacterium]
MRDRLPNFLFVMADQMVAPALPVYGHPLVKAPHIETLARQGVVFDNAYCNAPLCAPSRFSMLSGQLPSRIGAYDNAAEFPAATPTLPHYLRLMGYRTCTAGKMHFVGPDQLHGFEERLTTDIYPADFDWTPDWKRPETRLTWYHDMLSVTQAGVCARSLQIDFDDETAFRSVRRIYDFARDDDARPFFLAVSFSHPHDPYTITREYWDRYDHDAIDPPRVAPLPDAERDPHSRRLYRVTGMEAQTPTEAQTRNARHAYYGAISYVDDRLGELLHALDETGLAEDTVVIFTADHGDMLGERGMWYKMTFFEWSARVPLIVHAPARLAARRVAACVSLVDLLPTVLALAGDAAPEPADALDGKSLVPLLEGGRGGQDDTVLGEYFAEGAVAPLFMIRRGIHKYVACEADPPQLFDLTADPDERDNLAERPEHAERLAAFAAEAEARWDPAALGRAVTANQQRRRLVAEALGKGRRTSWDFRPRRDAAREYVRNYAVLGDIEQRARLPRPSLSDERPGNN